VVCSNALQQALSEMNTPDPAQLLNETRKKVISQFNKLGRSDQEVRDGMDISVLVFDKQFKKATFAGANHAVWIYSNGSSTPRILKGDKQPVGKYATDTPFTNTVVDWTTGDRIYLFTDGYADQFGGPDKKKLKNKQVQAFLTNIQDKPILEHGKMLEEYFISWQQAEDQVDDVTVIGLEI
jgi:serine phosphatase RsbU (regulator of sigma subunit)